jgi:hypothetical protein
MIFILLTYLLNITSFIGARGLQMRLAKAELASMGLITRASLTSFKASTSAAAQATPGSKEAGPGQGSLPPRRMGEANERRPPESGRDPPHPTSDEECPSSADAAESSLIEPPLEPSRPAPEVHSKSTLSGVLPPLILETSLSSSHVFKILCKGSG